MGDGSDGGVNQSDASDPSGTSQPDATVPPPTDTDPNSLTDEAAPPGGEDYTQMAPPTPFVPLPTSGGVGAVARSASSFNTLGSNDPQPVIQPTPTIYKGIDQTWNVYWMRPPNFRTTPGTLTGDDNWCQNGCHPICLAMLLNWWHLQNPDTSASGLTFPNPATPGTDQPQGNEPAANPAQPEAPGINPLTMCRQMFGMPYVPCVAAGSKFNVDHDKILGSVIPTDLGDGDTGPRDPSVGFQGGVSCVINGQLWPMRSARYGNWDGRDNLKKALKFLLQIGPVMLSLPRPGHYVLAVGYRNDTMYICDSGDVLINPKYWGTSPGVKRCSNGLVSVDCSASANLTFKDQTGLDFLQPANIACIEFYYFDDTATHADWSNPGSAPTPS